MLFGSFFAFEGKIYTSFTWMNDSFALVISLNYRKCQAKVVFKKIHLAEAAGDLYRYQAEGNFRMKRAVAVEVCNRLALQSSEQLTRDPLQGLVS